MTIKKNTINWTTDDRMIELLATGVESLESGNDGVGRAYLGAMGKGIAFRSLKLREKQSTKSKSK
jgi:hypothetical protein